MDQHLKQLIDTMQRTIGQDVSCFDHSFLEKTLSSRLEVAGLNPDAYCRRLEQDVVEAQALCAALRITYSEFFRNPLTFALLEQVVLPGLLDRAGKRGRGEVRIWSCACAAGQEVYSLAILLDELTADQKDAAHFRIFATDIDETELAAARAGSYDLAAVRNVPLKYIHACFFQHGRRYSLASRIRERVDFSVYDLLAQDSVCPPMSIYGDFDLVFVGNLLYYYNPAIRARILDKLHGCLKPGGYLVTGEAERSLVEQYGAFQTTLTPAPVFRKK